MSRALRRRSGSGWDAPSNAPTPWPTPTTGKRCSPRTTSPSGWDADPLAARLGPGCGPTVCSAYPAARADTRANPAGLTARQLAVPALLADGLTDAEVAQRLVLSVKTVNHHVSAVLDKLGVDNRREAARVATRTR